MVIICVPFDRNTVFFPKHMDKESENILNAFKYEVLDVAKKEIEFTKKSKSYREIRKQCKEVKAYIKQENLEIVPSDKTKRLCITDRDTHIKNTSSLLSNKEIYQLLPRSKCLSIERQANKLVNSCFKNSLNRNQLERLQVSNSKPAPFRTLIKDHKNKVGEMFPMRPIASAIHTPTEKIDWLCSKVLNQLVKFVPAHLNSSDELTDILDYFNGANDSGKFISLDVIALYPSIPITQALDIVIEFAKKHWSEIDRFNLTLEQFSNCLKFVSYNYEIQYEDQTYLQISGVPMGTHYAPPFAIIFMNYVESIALEKLKSVQISPSIYKRFIDDVIMGPFPSNFPYFDKIAEVFNGVNQKIQFTLEIPKQELNFLDLSIWERDHKIYYKHFTKPIASDNSLRKDSWIPRHVFYTCILHVF